MICRQTRHIIRSYSNLLPSGASMPIATSWGRWAAIASLALVLTCQAQAAEKFPARWRNTMTNDPGTNERLVKYAAPMPDPTEEALRIVLLARTAGLGCQSATIDRAALTGLVERSGVNAMTRKDVEAASERSAARFIGFDYQDLAHLCAGIDHLFGRNGVLARDLVSPGTGEPDFPYDPANPYITIHPLLPKSG